MKKCSKCKVDKELSEFNKRTKAKDGLRRQCRFCENEYKKQNKENSKKTNAIYYLKNKEKMNKKGKAWRDNNKNHRRTKGIEYRLKNKDKITEYREINKKHIVETKKLYREKNKETAKQYAKNYLIENKDRLLKYKKKYYLNKKCERVELLKKIIKPNSDNGWIYIMECGVFYKIGISEDPIKRVKEIERATQAPTSILFLCRANYGRTVDTETIIHHELNSLNISMPYKGLRNISREWFYGSINNIIGVVSSYCSIERISDDMFGGKSSGWED
jgi:hypothetical protein